MGIVVGIGVQRPLISAQILGVYGIDVVLDPGRQVFLGAPPIALGAEEGLVIGPPRFEDDRIQRVEACEMVAAAFQQIGREQSRQASVAVFERVDREKIQDG